jgi:hypothetical protein
MYIRPTLLRPRGMVTSASRWATCGSDPSTVRSAQRRPVRGLSATLPAGSYALVCLMPGHCAAGQHATFTVTG